MRRKVANKEATSGPDSALIVLLESGGTGRRRAGRVRQSGVSRPPSPQGCQGGVGGGSPARGHPDRPSGLRNKSLWMCLGSCTAAWGAKSACKFAGAMGRRRQWERSGSPGYSHPARSQARAGPKPRCIDSRRHAETEGGAARESQEVGSDPTRCKGGFRAPRTRTGPRPTTSFRASKLVNGSTGLDQSKTSEEGRRKAAGCWREGCR